MLLGGRALDPWTFCVVYIDGASFADHTVVVAMGIEETLTVHRLGVTGSLRRTLQMTNPIESAIDIVRSHACRVKRWNGGAMAMRWMGSGLVRAQGQFRRVKGHGQIPALIDALGNASSPDSKDVA